MDFLIDFFIFYCIIRPSWFFKKGGHHGMQQKDVVAQTIPRPVLDATVSILALSGRDRLYRAEPAVD